jgi:apolipoprotein N-acyltransferase
MRGAALGRALVAASPALAALLYTLASPPIDLSLLAWLVPGLLLAEAARVSPRRAFLHGATFGMLFACTASAWAVPAALAYFDRGTWYALLLVVAVWTVFGALSYGLVALATRLVRDRVPAPALPFCAAWLWVAVEWLRSNALTGLPWGVLAHSQWRVTPLIQVADLGGMYGISFVVAFVSVSCAEALVLLARATGDDRRGACVPLAASAALLAAVLGYGAWRLAGDPAGAGAPRTVTVIQSDVRHATRWQRGHAVRTIAAYASATRAAREPSDLVVWPESAVAFYPDRDPMMLARLAAVARDARAPLLFGGSRLDDDGGARNAVFLLGADGALRGAYDKQRLVPFGEYDPLAAAAGPADPAAGPASYAPGEHGDPLDTGALRVGPLVCYEALFPSLARQMVRGGAEVLVNVSNDAWLDTGSGVARAQQLAMSALRAVETRRPLVRAAAGGISGLVDAHGRLRETLPAGSGVLRLTVAPATGQTPYVRFGDAWLAAGGILFAALVLRGRR